jgi:two-component system CheB/CheR fusion protein
MAISENHQSSSINEEIQSLKQELHDKNQVLKSVIEGTLAGYWDWDIPKNKEFLSPTFKEMFGYQDHEMENSPESWQRIMHPDDLPITFAAFEAHVASRGAVPFTCEVRYYHKNGSIVWVWCKGKVIEWDKNGAPLRAVGSHVDISERKQFEIALKSSEERFRRAFENAGVGMALIDPKGEITSCNGMLAELFALEDQEQLKGSNIDEFYTLNNEGALKTNFEDLISGKISAFQEEHQLKKSNGEWFWANFTMSTVKDLVSSKVVQVIVIIKDTTAKHEALESLERSNRDLEQFAYLTSHDLQEPLRTVIAFSDIIGESLSEPLTPESLKEVKRQLSFVNGASLRMSKQIQDILEYSKIGSNLTFVLCNMEELMEEVLEDLNATLKEKKVIFSSDPLPTLNAQAAELRMLLMNLLSNAVKFQNEGEIPKIHLACSEGPTHWEFDMSDNGIGIEAEYLERIFSIFQRLHTREAFEGTGIGLAHCKKIVELHGGEISVSSKFGEGSTFHFTINKALKS